MKFEKKHLILFIYVRMVYLIIIKRKKNNSGDGQNDNGKDNNDNDLVIMYVKKLNFSDEKITIELNKIINSYKDCLEQLSEIEQLLLNSNCFSVEGDKDEYKKFEKKIISNITQIYETIKKKFEKIKSISKPELNIDFNNIFETIKNYSSGIVEDLFNAIIAFFDGFFKIFENQDNVNIANLDEKDIEIINKWENIKKNIHEFLEELKEENNLLLE